MLKEVGVKEDTMLDLRVESVQLAEAKSLGLSCNI